METQTSTTVARLRAARKTLTTIETDYLRGVTDLWQASTFRHLDAARQFADDLASAGGVTQWMEAQRAYLAGVGELMRTDAAAWSDLLSSAGSQMSTVWMAPLKAPEAAAPPEAPAPVPAPAESASESDAETTALEFDDRLDRIHGIGAGFVRQLEEVGVTSLTQIAELDLDDLLDEGHPLHGLHARIESGGWVEQAQALLAGKPH